MKRDMEYRIKDAFDQIHADEALKEHTKSAVMAALQDAEANTATAQDTHAPTATAQSNDSALNAQELTKQRNLKRPSIMWRRLIPLAACLLLALVAMVGGYQLYFTPVAAISIDINPSLELNVNRFDRVISVDTYNEDGQHVADSVDVINMNYSDAVDAILANPEIADLLNNGELLSVSLACDDETTADTMYTQLESCTSHHQNASCSRANSADVEEAHEHGLSFGKYQAYLDAHACDESLTVEDAQHMTMRELHDISDADSENTSGNQNENGHGNAQGHHGRHTND